MNAEAIWTIARDRAGYHLRDHRHPSPGLVDVLLALAEGPAHGTEIARRAGRAQPWVTSRWLPRLWTFGFAEYVEVDPAEVKPGKAAGGRTARVWRLTRAGRELVAALEAELRTDQEGGDPMTPAEHDALAQVRDEVEWRLSSTALPLSGYQVDDVIQALRQLVADPGTRPAALVALGLDGEGDE